MFQGGTSTQKYIARLVRNRLAALLNIKSDDFWTAVQRIAQLLVLLGIPLFFYEQHLKTHRERIATTLSFVQNYQRGTLVAHRYNLLAPWTRYDLRALQKANPSSAVVDDLIMKMIETSKSKDTNGSLSQSIFALVDFFEGLNVCIEAGRCDKTVAVSYFQDYARRFFCLYRPFIVSLRDRQLMASYGQRLEAMATAPGPCGADVDQKET